MSAGRRPLAARDYKGAGRREGGFNIAQYQQFGIGLASGLAVALGVWLYDHRARPASEEPPAEAQEKRDSRSEAEADAAETSGGETGGPAGDYTFYDMLPKFEVVLPEQERDVRSNLPTEAVEQPGVYVLQAGSYRNLPDAQRLIEKLGKQGIDATIQKVQVDADAWHRVRIGPFRDLGKLNATRRELRAADIDAIVIRLGD